MPFLLYYYLVSERNSQRSWYSSQCLYSTKEKHYQADCIAAGACYPTLECVISCFLIYDQVFKFSLN